MDLGINGFLGRIKEHYDKVIAFAVLLALVTSLVLLVVAMIPMQRQEEAGFERWLKDLRPQHPDAALVESSAYDQALHSLQSPLLLVVPGGEGASNAWMFVPETRFNCRECRHPVAVAAETCPFCNTPVVPIEPETMDHDGDGMPTEWERQYGLDPFDASDAQKDFDGDGWTNLEEFTAGKDPTNPDSRPPAIGRVTLDNITGTQFGLRFNSRVTTGSGFKFGLNYRLPDGSMRTEFVKIGDTVEGFKVERYEEKSEPAKQPGLSKVDVSELILLTPKGEPITLVKERAVRYVELIAHLSLKLRDEVQRFEKRKGDSFEVDGGTYSVIDVDGKGGSVVIRGESADSTITIRQAPGDGTP